MIGAVDHEQLPALLATATVCVVPAASDLTPNPNVVYPTKILEYMACKRPIVAPKRETVALVVENNREALLFEPGDPIDLARKVLRLLGEPQLRDRIAAAAYERVRRDFTASAARRALRAAYAVVAEQFQQLEPDDDDAPKIEMLTDDDFEATVFEEAPLQAPAVDTALNRIGDPHALADALSQLDRGSTTSSSGQVAPPPPPAHPDDTLDRAPVAPALRADSHAWTTSALAAPPAPNGDEWVVTNVAAAVRAIESDPDTGGVSSDDGTPADGNRTPTPSVVSPAGENAFVAGEIDVPTPPPSHEFTAASELLGNAEPADPDTGGRTPPLQRRNP